MKRQRGGGGPAAMGECDKTAGAGDVVVGPKLTFTDIPQAIVVVAIVPHLSFGGAANLASTAKPYRDCYHWLVDGWAEKEAPKLLQRWVQEKRVPVVMPPRINLRQYPAKLSHAIAERIEKADGGGAGALPQEYMYAFVSLEASYNRYWADPVPMISAYRAYGSEKWAKEVVHALQDRRCKKLKELDITLYESWYCERSGANRVIEQKALQILRAEAQRIKEKGCDIILPKECGDESGQVRDLFKEKLDECDEVADALVDEGFTSLKDIALIPSDEIASKMVFDAGDLVELRRRASDYVQLAQRMHPVQIRYTRHHHKHGLFSASAAASATLKAQKAVARRRPPRNGA